MKRSLVLALALLIAPALVSAQVEVGLDAGFNIAMISEPDGFTGNIDNVNTFDLPSQAVRVAFSAGDMLLIESMVGFDWFKQGDSSDNTLLIMPGLNYLLGEQFYVRGEVGLYRYSESDGTDDFSYTQFGFGGAVGLRMPLGDAALFRVEAGLDRWLEAKDNDVIQQLAETDIRIGAGISAVIN
jgi:hypothetical protein